MPLALWLCGAVQLAERLPCVFEAWSPGLRFQRQGCAVGIGPPVVHSRFPSFRRRVIARVPERRIWARPTPHACDLRRQLMAPKGTRGPEKERNRVLGAIRAPGGHARPLTSSSGLSVPTPMVAVAGCRVPLRRPALKEGTVWAEL